MDTLTTVRRFFAFALVFFVAAAPVQAQPADTLILQGKRLLDRGYNQGDAGAMRRARAVFLRAAADEEHASLSRYYAGLAGYRLINVLDDEDRRAHFLDDAMAQLEKATKLRPEMAEAHALLSGVYGRKAGQGMMAGMKYGRKADRAIERARELAPQNPRVVLIDAIGTFHKPSMFGGDKEKALEGFQRAARLFEQEDVSDPLQPQWGHAEAYAWIGIAHMKADRPAPARQAFERALQINPDFGWVKDVLMPQLASAGNSK